MQVSWIEPDQLRDLVGQLQRPPGKAANVAWELHTLPNPAGLGARELGIEDGDLWLPDPKAPSEAPAARSLPESSDPLFAPMTPVEELRHEVSPAPASPEHDPEPAADEGEDTPIEQPKELSRIRERLQAIRERAVEAGLLAHVGVRSEVPVENPAAAAAVPADLAPSEAERVVEAGPEPIVVAAPAIVDAPAEPVVAETPAIERAENLLPVSSPFALAEPVLDSADASAAQHSSSFEMPVGALTERLEAFASWSARQLGLNDLLIVDDHGDILWGIHEHAGLVVSAMMACKATMRSSALGAAGLSRIIEQPISIDRMLIVVPCDTSYGTLSIAFVHVGKFNEMDGNLLRDALAIAIETRPVSVPPSHGSALD